MAYIEKDITPPSFFDSDPVGDHFSATANASAYLGGVASGFEVRVPEAEPTQEFLIQTAVKEDRIEDAVNLWREWHENLSGKIKSGETVADKELEELEASLLFLPVEPLGEVVGKANRGETVEPTVLPTAAILTKKFTDSLRSPKIQAHYLALMLGNFIYDYSNNSWKRVSLDSWHPNEADMEWLVDKAYEFRDFPETRERIEVALKLNPDMLLRLAMVAVRKNHISTNS